MSCPVFEEGSYLVKSEPSLLEGRELAFPNLSAARYFARTWAHKSRVAILVVDRRSGEPLERYSRTSRSLENSAVANLAPA